LPTKKSDLLDQLSNNYPNFFRKDLVKLINIFVIEIKNSLKRKERVELRDVFSLEPKLQKAKYARNPKTNERIFIEEKYSINFKSSKYWLKKINEKK
tara:strand:+ start:578 stop:868 length:291 start_codon:yes stop_codon:yes gene_type:complete